MQNAPAKRKQPADRSAGRFITQAFSGARDTFRVA
jgi:hypothetical protein